MSLLSKQDRPRAEPAKPTDGPAPQPERHEPSVPDPRLRDLTFADWKAIVVRGFKGFMDDNAMMLASALAYSSFFAIPSLLIVATGLFTLIAGPDDDREPDAASARRHPGAGDAAARRLVAARRREPRRRASC